MTIWKSYKIPQSLNELFCLLDENSSCSIVAGGTDLLLEIQQGHHPPVDTLIDVSRLPDLISLEIRADRLFIGAAVPLNQVSTSSLVNKHAHALAESTGQIGGPQVRAVGTLGGNVGHALPAGDGVISLLALDARAEVATRAGCREVPLVELYKGPGETALKRQEEVITGFYVNTTKPGEASAFARIMRPQGVALPVLNMAGWISIKHNLITKARIAIGPSGPTPKRALELEDAICGMDIDELKFSKLFTVLHDSVKFRSSPLRASSAYRDQLAEVLLQRVLNTAIQRAKESVGA
jgi:carbon-monoxide dehydrogenase medium subunit